MSEWLHFNEGGNALEPDISLGCYEVWLSSIPPGLSQADRVLIHTSMLEQAHERRFAVTEMGLDMSHFETEHRERIQSCLSTLDSHFIRHGSLEPHLSRQSKEEDLIGLRYSMEQTTVPQWLVLDKVDVSSTSPPPRNLPNPRLPSTIGADGSRSRETTIEADDEMELDFEAAWQQSSTGIVSGYLRTNVSRTQRKVRLRKRAAPYALPESKKTTAPKPDERLAKKSQR